MSRYGNLVKTEGHSKYFLTNTLAEHDDTMDHPFMKQIYDCSLSQEHLSRYLAGQYWMFAALEAAVGPRKAEPLLAPVYDAALERAASLDADLRYHCGRNWQKSEALRPEAAGSAQLREMLAQLAADAAADDGGERLMVHHFLQYNAVLSGGQYLKRMLNQKLELPASNKEGVSFFCFPGVPTATRVRTYLEVLDTLPLDSEPEQRPRVLAHMKLVYALALGMLDEIVPRGEFHGLAGAAEWTEAEKGVEGSGWVGEMGLAELNGNHGRGHSKRILMAIRGRILDVSKNHDAYGPKGNYSMFAGHDVTRCLTTMSLGAADLDDLEFLPVEEPQKAALAKWEARLSAQYQVMGYVAGDERRSASIAPTVDVDLAAEMIKSSAAGSGSGAAAVGGGAGGEHAAGATYPLGFTEEMAAAMGMENPHKKKNGSDVAASAAANPAEAKECPWPFMCV